MEGKETRNSNKQKSQVDQNEKNMKHKTQTLAKDRKGRKNGNQKTDCVHKLY